MKPIVHQSLRSLIVLTLLIASQGQIPIWSQPTEVKVSEQYEHSEQTTPSNIASSSSLQFQVPSADDQSLLDKISALQWSPQLQDVKLIPWKDVIRQTEKNNLEIQLSREKVTETEVKKQDVEMKRVLFFFKYFDSAFLEGSAESDVLAANAHSQAVMNEALLESVTKYYNLMRAILTQYIGYQAIEQGKNQMKLNQKRFESGEATSFELMQTKTQLVKRYQEFLQAGITYKLASFALSEQIGEKATDNPQNKIGDDVTQDLLYPADLSFHDGEFEMPVFRFFGNKDSDHPLTANETIKIAQENRPEFKELKFRKISLENLHQASTVKFDRVQEKILQSSLKQLDLKRQKTEMAVQAMVLKAYEDYQFSDKKVSLALEQLAIANKALKQAQVSHQAGFSSNKDVLDAQVTSSQSRVNFANALIDYNLSQVQLLYEMGLIGVEPLVEGHIDL